MARARRYSKDEVIAILEQSEGRMSPKTHQPGHALKEHVLIADHQLTDRLIATLGQTTPGRPILVDPTGQVVSKALHREIWKETNLGLNSKTANEEFDRIFLGDSVGKAGAFADLQQAGVLGKFALNSPGGQTELAKLDALAANTYDRVKIVYSVKNLHSTEGEWRMRYAEKGNDLPALKAFSEVWMFVDNLLPDGIHIQTFFPVA
jgi:hypothetical protein